MRAGLPAGGAGAEVVDADLVADDGEETAHRALKNGQKEKDRK